MVKNSPVVGGLGTIYEHDLQITKFKKLYGVPLYLEHLMCLSQAVITAHPLQRCKGEVSKFIEIELLEFLVCLPHL